MIAGHPHTVSASRVPLYLQGFGQDDGLTFEPSTYDPGTTLIDPTMEPTTLPDIFVPTSAGEPTSELTPGGTLIPPPSVDPQTAALAQLYQSAVASGAMTQSQAAAAIAQLSAGATNVAKAATGLTTAPSPRVAVPPVPGSVSSLLSSQSIIKGVPDILILGGGLLAIAAMGRR